MNFIRKQNWSSLTIAIVTIRYFFSIASANAQSRKIENALTAAQKEDRVNLLNELASAFARSDSAKTMILLERGTGAFEKIDYCRSHAKGTHVKAMVLYFSNNHKTFVL